MSAYKGLVKPELTQKRLQELFDYSPETGEFVRKVRVNNRVKVGDIAGYNLGEGYSAFMVDGRTYYAHRLAWLYVHGTWPAHQVDHKWGDRRDNRITELRDLTEGENHQNLHRPHRDNKLGILGVFQVGKRFQAGIKLKGKRTYLGTYDTPELAHAAYLAAKRKLHTACLI